MHNKAIFLDRDDTIIEDPGYINNPDMVKLIPGAAAALFDLRKMGYKIIVVSNQSGIARGILTEQILGKIHERLKQLLAGENAYLDKIYYCPFLADGAVQKYRKDSDLRKPKPGMLLLAAREMDIDLKNSWMVGNDYRDVAAGKAAGCRTVIIKSHLKRPVKQLTDPDADFEAINLRETVNIIKRETMPKPVIEPRSEPAPSEPVQSVKIEPPSVTVENSNAERHPEAEPVEESPVTPPVEIPKMQEIQIEVEPACTEPCRSARSEPARPEQSRGAEPAQQVFENEIIETVLHKNPKPPAGVPEISDNSDSKTEHLLEEIKHLLKTRHRQEQYPDFSFFKFFAAFLQIIVPFCLVVALWFRLSPTGKDSAVFTALGFAIVFQLMALTIYIMHKEK